MSTPPAGWYPTGDGGSRYWDGDRWTGDVHPGAASRAAAAATSSPTTDATSPRPGPRPMPGAGWFGWGGLLLVAGLGAATSGVSGAGILGGLFVAVVGVVALARGRVGWAHLRNRAAGGAALGVAVALFAVGGATADPQPGATPRAGPATPSTQREAAPTASATTTPPPTRSSTTAAPTTPTAVATTPTVTAAAKGTALVAATALPVKGRAPKTGYNRALFGQAWFDADRNGCDTRIICMA